jgi:hypothetical protein
MFKIKSAVWMLNIAFIVANLLIVSACSARPQPTQTALPPIETNKPVPQSDQFAGLPFHLMGETVEAGGYIIKIENIRLNPRSISVSADITNNSERPIDLSSALNLYAPDGFRILPNDMAGSLEPGNSTQLEFSYALPMPFAQSEIMEYRLVFTPFGWSGPVIVYLLVESLPDVPAPPTPREEDIPRPVTPQGNAPSTQPYNGITGDPWKMLVLIYPNIDTDYVENGQNKHLTATMPAADVAAMKADFMDNLPHQNIVYDYSGNTAEMEAHVIEVSRPLTNLAPIGSGYWPDPDVTRQELDLYAPPGKYDSVIVFWQVSNPNTGQSLPTYGWGLGYWPYDFANGMTYATVFNISWVWPNDGCHGEVFLHEWLHGVTGFYKDHLGFAFNVEDLHGAEEAGYQDDYTQDGCWDLWLRDYMRGLVYENNQRKALVPETWQSGSITTHHINGWRGEYFNNETLSGIPVLVRDDADLNFFWELNSPHPLINADHFSARWTRSLTFSAGTYRFNATRDDGLRIYVDNNLILDKWFYGYTNESVDYYLTSGPHIIKVEMYEIDGWASTILNIVPIAQSNTFRSAGTYDGYIWESVETSNIGLNYRSADTTFILGDDNSDRQYRAILAFNTSALPDNAIIKKITLKIRQQGYAVGTDPFTTHGGLKVDIRKPYFGTSLSLLANDFQAAANGSAIGTFGTTSVNSWYTAILGNSAFPFINLTGTTQFRLRFAKDDNDDMSADYMRFISGDYATASARPTLIIEYQTP